MKFISILKDGHKFDELMKDGPALVKFFHPSCGHCKDMAPHWDSLKDKLKDHHHRNVNVIEVHADTLPDIKSDCAKNIPGYPTIMEVLQEISRLKCYLEQTKLSLVNNGLIINY